MKLNKGLVQVYDGNGKGKTTAAFGLALRAIGQGLKVHVIQFLKCSNRYGELKTIGKFSPQAKVTQVGPPCKSDDKSGKFECTGCMKCHVDPQNPSAQDIESARRGLELARTVSSEPSCDVLILDELNYAVSMGLLEIKDVVEVISSRSPNVEIVVTGRGTPRELLEMADLVTTATEIKHHYKKGISEIMGIDY